MGDRFARLAVPAGVQHAIALRNACLDSACPDADIVALAEARPATAGGIAAMAHRLHPAAGGANQSFARLLASIGRPRLRSLALQLALAEWVFAFDSPVLSDFAHSLHAHSVAVALITEALAKRADQPWAEEASAAALLHEVPLLVWLRDSDPLQFDQDDRDLIAKAARRTPLVPMDFAMLEIDLPHLATIARDRSKLIAQAHRLAWCENPLRDEGSVDGHLPELDELPRLRAHGQALIEASAHAVRSRRAQRAGFAAPFAPPAGNGRITLLACGALMALALGAWYALTLL